jgi:hypothetical protein
MLPPLSRSGPPAQEGEENGQEKGQDECRPVVVAVAEGVPHGVPTPYSVKTEPAWKLGDAG